MSIALLFKELVTLPNLYAVCMYVDMHACMHVLVYHATTHCNNKKCTFISFLLVKSCYDVNIEMNYFHYSLAHYASIFCYAKGYLLCLKLCQHI